MFAVMADPSLAEDLSTEAAVPRLAPPRIVGELFPLFDVEGVRRRAEADDRLAGLDVVGDVLHLFVGQVAEA